MPLIKSKSKKAFSKNVSEVVNSYKAKGTIGNTHPKSAEHARKIAVAIAYSQQKAAGGKG